MIHLVTLKRLFTTVGVVVLNILHYHNDIAFYIELQIMHRGITSITHSEDNPTYQVSNYPQTELKSKVYYTGYIKLSWKTFSALT